MNSINHPPQTLQQSLANRYEAGSEYGTQRRPLHHRPLFWGGVVIFVLALSIFVFSDSLAWLPLNH